MYRSLLQDDDEGYAAGMGMAPVHHLWSVQGGGGGAEEEKQRGQVTPTSWSAWWVLFWYAYIAALQSLLWMTYSSVPDDSRDYLKTDNSTLDLFLDWGPVGYVVAVAGALWLLSFRADGLTISVRLAAGLCLFSSVLRCLPLVLTDDQKENNHNAVLAAVHIAQFVNGSVAPLVVASPALLSLRWFAEDWRNTATAVANVASALGRAIGFFLGPALVSTASDLPTLLLLEIGLAGLPFLAVLIYYPVAPSTPPSRAAEEEAQAMELKSRKMELAKLDMEGNGQGCCGTVSTSASTAAKEVLAAIRVPSFLLLAVAGGVEMAVYGAWSGVLPTVLSPKFTDTQAGALLYCYII